MPADEPYLISRALRLAEVLPARSSLARRLRASAEAYRMALIDEALDPRRADRLEEELVEVVEEAEALLNGVDALPADDEEGGGDDGNDGDGP